MKRAWLKLFSCILCVILFIGMIPITSQAASIPSIVTVSTTAQVYRQQTREVLKLVNEERAKKGRPPYIMDERLEEAAIQRAFELIPYCTHVRPDGRTFNTVFSEYGVKIDLWLGGAIGENIASGQSDAASVMNSWMNSDGHKYQILSPTYTTIGIGCVEYNGVKFWVQLFGTDPDGGRIPASSTGTDGTEMTRECSIDTEKLIKNSNFKTASSHFLQPQVSGKPGEDFTFDLTLKVPDIIWQRNRDVGSILFSSLKAENIILPEDSPITVDESGIHVSPDANPGTYPLTVQIGSLSTVKNITVATCSHPQSSQKTEEQAATCSQEGYQKIICTECGETISEKTLPKIPHKAESEWETVQQPTCSEDGLQVKKCVYCNTVVEKQSIPKTEDHQWNQGDVVKNPTCTEAGTTTYTCTICQKTRIETVAALGHQADDWEIIQEATCAHAGLKVQKCTRCGIVLNREDIPKTEDHNWDQGTVTKESTCTESGIKNFICQICGENHTEVLPALGHNKQIHITDATCTQSGTKQVVCSRCNQILSEETLPALGHSWSSWNIEQEATWNTDGLQTHSCIRCNETEEQIIPKLSETHQHSFTGTETLITKPTCTEEGEKSIACNNPNCKEEITVSIPALGHQSSKWEIVKKATCTEAGLRVQKCAVCGGTLKKERMETVDHVFDKWVIIKEATQSEEGIRQRNCLICGQAQTEKIAKLPAPANTNDEVNSDNIQTGENFPIVFWIGLMGGIAILQCCLILNRKRIKEK